MEANFWGSFLALKKREPELRLNWGSNEVSSFSLAIRTDIPYPP
jgi:hypothetical protein